MAIYFGDHHPHWLHIDSLKGLTQKQNKTKQKNNPNKQTNQTKANRKQTPTSTGNQAFSEVFKAERILLPACSTALGFSSHEVKDCHVPGDPQQ